MKDKIKTYLSILAIVVIAGILFKKCNGCNPEPVIDNSGNIQKPITIKETKTDDGTIPIIDSSGKVVRTKIPNAKNVEKVISIKNPPDSNGNPTPPTTLIVERKPPGFLPEVFGGNKITISSLGNDSNVKVIDIEEPNFDFEHNPTVGVMYSRKGIEATIGVNLVKVYFAHISASASYSSGEIQPNLDLNVGAKIELLPYIFTGYNYGVLSGEHKVSLEYCLKL